MLLLRIAIVLMLAALGSAVVMFATGSVAALYTCVACVVASYLCVVCDSYVYKRNMQRKIVKQRLQRIANSAHTNKYTWM